MWTGRRTLLRLMKLPGLIWIAGGVRCALIGWSGLGLVGRGECREVARRLGIGVLE